MAAVYAGRMGDATASARCARGGLTLTEVGRGLLSS
jgi:hypothetical protein